MRNLLKLSLVLAVMALTMSSCNCYNKMAKKIDDVQLSANPELLSLKGQTVSTDITVTFPAKYVQKKGVLKVTPVLEFEGGSLEGTPKFIQGENVKDNYTVIDNGNGGTYTQTVTFPYDSRADISTLVLAVEAKCKDGVFREIARIPVARGISTVQNMADWTAYMAIMPDNFKRVTTITEDADLMYQINSSQVRPAALKSDQIKLLEEFVKENSTKDRTTLGNIYAKGYASPDGPETLNDKLSKDRSNTGKDAISKKLKNVPGAKFDAAAYGEDWDGFKKLVEGSNIKDKDLILQVLNMYNSPAQRDQEIKNMSKVYDVLKKDILPQLRRTQLVASADISGKTDAELMDAAKNDINSLTLEEMLFSATLTNDIAEKARIYKAAADKFNDVRAYNNYGVALAKQGKIADAKAAIEKAAKINSAPEISNNLGVLALAEGKVEEARKYQSSMNVGTRALLALADGDYATAVKNLDGYNLAVAEFCNGNIAKAKAALGNISTGQADYLRAVIAMREGDTAAAKANLNAAGEKCACLKERAKKDIEFSKL